MGNAFSVSGSKQVRRTRAALRAPDAEILRRHVKRPAIGVEREAGLIGLLLEAEGHDVGDGAFFAVMLPVEALAGDRRHRGEGLPVPRGGADGSGEQIAKVSSVGHECLVRRVLTLRDFADGMRRSRPSDFARASTEASPSLTLDDEPKQG